MWISEKWRDYELLDASSGERLEKWGGRILVRPDPQVIWETPRSNRGWQNFDARYFRSSSGGGKWEIKNLPKSWTISYGELRFNVKPMNFKHTGIFPEQAVNWDYVREKIRFAGRKIEVLALFAYTGAMTLSAASAGASVCHVDSAKGMVAWARENALVSGMSNLPVRWIVDDCVKFVERERKRGKRYDAIIMDPPSYGRGPSGETWKLQDNLWDFLRLTADVLTDDPLFVMINSYTTGLSAKTLEYLSDSVFTSRFGGRSESRELGLRVEESGLLLPCGATCRWEA